MLLTHKGVKKAPTIFSTSLFIVTHTNTPQVNSHHIKNQLINCTHYTLYSYCEYKIAGGCGVRWVWQYVVPPPPPPPPR